MQFTESKDWEGCQTACLGPTAESLSGAHSARAGEDAVTSDPGQLGLAAAHGRLQVMPGQLGTEESNCHG